MILDITLIAVTVALAAAVAVGAWVAVAAIYAAGLVVMAGVFVVKVGAVAPEDRVATALVGAILTAAWPLTVVSILILILNGDR